MIVGILATLKAGAAYVPLSPDYPVERADFILVDTQAKILLKQHSEEEKIRDFVDAGGDNVTILLTDDEEKNYRQPEGKVERKSQPTDLAYVIYTSGSTGQPTGVMIEQKRVVNLISHVVQSHQLD